MALDTYDNLVKEIIDWSHRGDLGTKIPDFILLAENAMYSNSAEALKVRSMEVVSTAPVSGAYLSLPDDFESNRSVRLTNDNTGEIKYQSPQQMSKRPGTGLPFFFTIVGNEIQFDIAPDNNYTIELQYFRKATPLTDDNQTNEILTSHPSIYLYGALAALFRYTQDTEEALFNEQRFIESIKGANKADKKGRYGPALYSSPSGVVV